MSKIRIETTCLSAHSILTIARNKQANQQITAKAHNYKWERVCSVPDHALREQDQTGCYESEEMSTDTQSTPCVLQSRKWLLDYHSDNSSSEPKRLLSSCARDTNCTLPLLPGVHDKQDRDNSPC